METSQIRDEFKEIFAGVVKDNDGVPTEIAADIAKAILTESGKDRRTAMMNQSRQNGNAVNGNGNGYRNGDQPATWKQKKTLQNLGVRYEAGITKSQASQLLDEAFAKQNGQR